MTTKTDSLLSNLCHWRDCAKLTDEQCSVIHVSHLSLIIVALEAAQQQIKDFGLVHVPQYEYAKMWQRALNAEERIAELEASQPVVPEGWKLVPLKATKAMKDACDYTPGPMTGYMAWKVMIEVAPALQEE